MEKICFEASFPDISSALNISGNKNGMRVKIDIPETFRAEGAKLLLLREKAFKVTIEEVE